MGSKLIFSFLLLALACFAKGWDQDSEYQYSYNGKVFIGLQELKQQHAIVEMVGRLIVQSQSDDTLVVKLSDVRMERQGDYEEDPYSRQNVDEMDHSILPQGQKESIPNLELLESPFVIKHKKGSVLNLIISSQEPLWMVNMKKAIASQLQLDVTGVRSELKMDSSLPQDLNTAINVYENSVTGDCSTMIQINRLPASQIIEKNVTDEVLYDSLCKNENVYEISKMKDFSRCLNNPIYNSVSSPMYACSLGTNNCGEAIQRVAMTTYIGCGSSPDKLDIIRSEAFGELVAKPFGIKTKELINTAMVTLVLQKKQSIDSQLSSPSSPKQLESLAYTFPMMDTLKNPRLGARMLDMASLPDLTSAPEKALVDKSMIKKSILDVLVQVSKDLKETTTSDRDLIGRLSAVRRALPMLSLDDLRDLWAKVKSEDTPVKDMMVDTVVAAGTNPCVMLVKELIEKKEIKEDKAISAMFALGHSVKTPTRELLQELIKLVKSSAVQSSKALKQTSLLNLADLLSVACDSPFLKQKRFPVQLMGEFCDKKDSIIRDEFLPLLVEELKNAEETGADKMTALTALGTLGTEDILPILLPYIQGNEAGDDTAVRTRAILALHRVIFTNPERLYPMLSGIADNTAERPEVRMAAIAVLLTVNTPLAIWQKVAYRTWFDSSKQVQSFTYNLLSSLAEIPVASPLHQEISTKARLALNLAQPGKQGLPWSASTMKATFSEQGLGAIRHIPMWRVGDESLPVAIGLRQVLQLGPFMADPIQLYVWNYNMEDVWQKLVERLSGVSAKSLLMNKSSNELQEIWDQIKPQRRPADKRAGILQMNIMGSSLRIFDLENIDKILPKMLSDISEEVSGSMPVNLLKYRMLAELNMQIPTEMGLPVRLLTHIPLLASIQGKVKADDSLQFDGVSMLSIKMNTEMRTELPFSGNYVASGADVRAAVRGPSNLNLKYRKGQVKITWNPSNKITDLLYFHVKPYTITRNVARTATPTLEDPSVHLVSLKENWTSKKIDMPLLNRYGINMRLIASSDMPYNDAASWMEWLSKWDLNSISKAALIPLSLPQREYRLRYVPEGTKSQAVSASIQYVHLTKSSQKNINIVSGTSRVKPAAPMITVGVLSDETKAISERLMKNMDGGDAHILVAGMKFSQKDDKMIEMTASLGSSIDDTYTKNNVDIRMEHSIASSSGSKVVEYALCGSGSRSWNTPPHFGFSSENLYQTEDARIVFGKSCEGGASIHLKTKAYRDEVAVNHLRNSQIGKECRQDMNNGLMDSPKCKEARDLDQTYNVYEMEAEYSNIPAPVAEAMQSIRSSVNTILYPFIESHRLESNEQDRISLVIKRDPASGAVDLKIRQPKESLEAKKIRLTAMPMTSKVLSVLFPVKARENAISLGKKLIYGGLTKAQCYVGQNQITTYDGASYNYTLNDCQHVLLTDCSKKMKYAILARNTEDRKIIKVITEKDVIEIDPSGKVTINDVTKQLDANKRIEIHDENSIKVAVTGILKGIKVELPELGMELKIRGPHATLGAPLSLRGKACGLCGDFDQEITGEFKTASRCVVSSGSAMASTFKVNGGECSSLRDRLDDPKGELDSCKSVDEHIRSDLRMEELSKPTKCNKLERMTIPGPEKGITCESASPVVQCAPGCKPAYLISKSIKFTCSSGSVSPIRSVVTVPSSCIKA